MPSVSVMTLFPHLTHPSQHLGLTPCGTFSVTIPVSTIVAISLCVAYNELDSDRKPYEDPEENQMPSGLPLQSLAAFFLLRAQHFDLPGPVWLHCLSTSAAALSMSTFSTRTSRLKPQVSHPASSTVRALYKETANILSSFSIAPAAQKSYVLRLCLSVLLGLSCWVYTYPMLLSLMRQAGPAPSSAIAGTIMVAGAFCAS